MFFKNTVFRRVLCLFLAMFLTFSLAACNKEETTSKVESSTSTGGSSAYPPRTDFSGLDLKPEKIKLGYDLNPDVIAVCSVADFGAKGDGETDDTQAFVDALAYAASLGGGTVFVPAGRYVIKSSLTLLNSVSLAGVWYNPETEPEKAADGPGDCLGQGAWEISGTKKGPKAWFSHTLGPYF